MSRCKKTRSEVILIYSLNVVAKALVKSKAHVLEVLAHVTLSWLLRS